LQEQPWTDIDVLVVLIVLFLTNTQ